MAKSKWFALLSIVLIFAFVLSGCAPAAAPAAPAAAAPDAAAPAAAAAIPVAADGSYKIAYLPTQIGQPVTKAWQTGMERVFGQFKNVQFQAFDGQMKAEIQVSVMEDLINQGYSLILLQPVDAAALSASVQKAESKGIAVITLNTP